MATSDRLTGKSEDEAGATGSSIRWPTLSSAWCGNEGEVVDDPAQSAGHGTTISFSLMRVVSSAACPSTRAWRGLQQQWPCSTQQAIVQTSAVALAASATGALIAPTSKASAASKARHLARLLCRSAFIGSNLIPGISVHSTRFFQ
jgi:hypothetical protein